MPANVSEQLGSHRADSGARPESRPPSGAGPPQRPEARARRPSDRGAETGHGDVPGAPDGSPRPGRSPRRRPPPPIASGHGCDRARIAMKTAGNTKSSPNRWGSGIRPPSSPPGWRRRRRRRRSRSPAGEVRGAGRLPREARHGEGVGLVADPVRQQCQPPAREVGEVRRQARRHQVVAQVDDVGRDARGARRAPRLQHGQRDELGRPGGDEQAHRHELPERQAGLAGEAAPHGAVGEDARDDGRQAVADARPRLGPGRGRPRAGTQRTPPLIRDGVNRGERKTEPRGLRGKPRGRYGDWRR